MRERVERIKGVLAALHADWAVLTSPEAVCYATDHVVPVEAGPSPFSGGPTTALIGRDGVVALLGPSDQWGTAPAVDLLRGYAGYVWSEPADQARNFRDAAAALAGELRVSGTLAVEPASFTAVLAQVLGGPTVPIGPELDRARAVKTPGELSRLKRAAAVAAAGQRAARERCRAGRSELEVFAEIRGAMEHAAGRRCAVTGDFLSGTARTAAVSGWPTGRALEAGDPVICDLAPRVDGYWGDSCGSFRLVHPDPAYDAMFVACRTALEAAEALIRPGLPAAELDAALRGIVAAHGYAYPHHSGHGIGTGVHEHPRIVPYETACLEENMVIMIEPGAYQPDIGGVRLEWMFKVTSTGASALSKFRVDPTSLESAQREDSNLYASLKQTKR